MQCKYFNVISAVDDHVPERDPHADGDIGGVVGGLGEPPLDLAPFPFASSLESV